jgi:hypothetical protein
VNLVILALERAYERRLASHAERARARRFRLANAGFCINGKTHGAPEPGKTKCTACLEQHRKSNRRRAA